MKQVFFISLLLCLGTTAYSQVIKGTIFDAETKQSIPYAAVFINGTFIGTTSDEEGAFELDITNYTLTPLTIRAIGYETCAVKSIPSNEALIIYLTPSFFEIDEAEVQAKNLSRQRKANLKLFRREFIGTSRIQKQCQIINEEDITFNYGSDNDTLKAYARNPIQIYNGFLGYVITYYLDEFEYDKNNRVVFFTGDIVFTEDLIKKQSTDNSYTSRRKRTYLGSSMHFFRALWDNNLIMHGFTVAKYSFNLTSLGVRSSNLPIADIRYQDVDVRYEDIVVEEDENRKYLIATKKLLLINYKFVDESTILFLKPKVLFGENGFFDPSGILWYGYMAELRIADMLPYEYELEK